MKKKNYVSKAVMLGALLAPIGMPTVSVLADSFYQNQTRTFYYFLRHLPLQW